MSEEAVVPSDELERRRLVREGLDGDPLELPPDRAKAELVLRVLRAGGLTPPYGWDADDGIRLWGAKLAAFTTAAVSAAANEIIGAPGKEFPTLGDFIVCATYHERELQRQGDPRAPGACPECGDCPEDRTRGQVMIGKPGDASIFFRPCSLCNPEGYDLWKRRHFNTRDLGDRCHCASEHCPHKPKGKKR